MKKVLYILSSLKKTGPVNQLYNIINNINHEDYEIYLLTLSKEPNESRWKDFSSLGIKMETLNKSGIIKLIIAKNELIKHIEKTKPDIIHTQGIRADILSSIIIKDLPKLCTIRNFPKIDYEMTYGKLLGNIMSFVHKTIMKKINVCVTVSDSVRNYLEKQYGIKNTVTIRNGVETNLFCKPEKDEKHYLRDKYGFSPEQKIWITSGNLTERKNPLMIIEAFKNCFNNNDNILIFIGNGNLEQKCKNAVEDNKNIFFFGRVKNVVEYYKISDYYISASKAEGLPNAVLEAMACGLPILLSDIEPHKEIVTLNQNMGLLFSTDSINDLKEKLLIMGSCDYNKMQKSVENVINNYLSAKVMGVNYMKLYDKLISNKISV